MGSERENALQSMTSCLELQEETCSICQHQFGETPHVPVRRLTCGHCFHGACVQQLLDRNQPCPLCRSSTSTPPEQSLDHTIPRYNSNSHSVWNNFQTAANAVCNTGRRKAFDGQSLLCKSQNGDCDGVRALLNSGVDVNFRSLKNATPLMFAATHGHCELIRLLLANNANVHLCTDDGNTALYLAACQGHVDAVAILLEAGAKPDHRNAAGVTATMVAAHQRHAAVLELIQRRA